jgi:hypothetical protein
VFNVHLIRQISDILNSINEIPIYLRSSINVCDECRVSLMGSFLSALSIISVTAGLRETLGDCLEIHRPSPTQ